MSLARLSHGHATLAAIMFAVSYCHGFAAQPKGQAEFERADLLVVGGTESGCAAAIQAARMGIQRIVLVNDIQWLGGQFSAEALGAIDENRAEGYDGTVPIPRSGIFREVIDAIEQNNAQQFLGVRRPGNTRVITTARPRDAEHVFRSLLAPYEKRGTIRRYSDLHVHSVVLDQSRVRQVRFALSSGELALTVDARLVIDASDFGDVVQKSGAAWDVGIDAKDEYGEPSAPESPEPPTDINPLTWCLILEQQKTEALIERPVGYDPKYFDGTWGWINETFSYTSRRLIDGQSLMQRPDNPAGHFIPDVLLINSPPIDYPVDVYPASVAQALEATERGASTKSLVAMTPEQREIVFADARLHTMKYYYHLQKRFPKFRYMAASQEFGTPDRLPPKPYVRESLRTITQHVVREQEVLGFGGRTNYATTMYPDAIFSWQFELDFHPTKRAWTTQQGDRGPWEAVFRGNRRFHRGGTGRSVFPLRGLVPEKVRGLLVAQKNLGYTSIVSSSCRLHDHSIHAGQACGAVAAVSLNRDVAPEDMALRQDLLAEIWNGLLNPPEGTPLVIWPFADVDPADQDFAAIQQLALRRLLPMGPGDTKFMPDEAASSQWIGQVSARAVAGGYDAPQIAVTRTERRRNIAKIVWNHIRTQTLAAVKPIAPKDIDGDGILDSEDPLPRTPGIESWATDPATDGLPDRELGKGALAFNFSAVKTKPIPGFQLDHGAPYQEANGFGWLKDLTGNTRLRAKSADPLNDGFVFTRKQDIWQCRVDNGRWQVSACIGDIGHAQPGQNLKIQEAVVAKGADTSAGFFRELTTTVEVTDQMLTLTLGVPEGGSNTCIVWLVIRPER